MAKGNGKATKKATKKEAQVRLSRPTTAPASRRRTRSNPRKSFQSSPLPKPSPEKTNKIRQPAKLRYRAWISDTEETEAELSSDSEPPSQVRKPSKIPKTRIMKEATVPQRSANAAPPQGASHSRNRYVAASSSSPSIVDLTSDYDTPNTSLAVTPAEPSSRNISASNTSTEAPAPSKPQKLKGTSATARAEQLRNSFFANGSSFSTRKRPIVEISCKYPDDSPDARLARQLQAEEYEKSDSKRFKPSAYEDDNSEDPVATRKDGDALLDSNVDDVVSIRSYLDDESTDGSSHEFDDEESLHLGLFSWDTYETPQQRRAKKERRRLENAHPQVRTMWYDLEDIPVIVPVQAPQPTTISRNLKPFQREGLDWMIKQEKSLWKGGLLGDEMGMGKTIQAVSLIMSDFPAKNPTLVVVPPVALMQWQSEIKEYTNGKLNVFLFHNTNSKVKSMTPGDLKKYNVIMISYSGLESLYRKETKGWPRNGGIIKEDSVIHAIHFHRLILDEAHSIKTRQTSVAKACFALKADYKWCLSGTPVQNRIGEFFSLLRFLEVKPFACYFCKTCGCAEMHWAQDAARKCVHCGHRGFDHVSVFNQEILNPIVSRDNPFVREDALRKLKLITDRIMLRRVKRDHTASMELPPKQVILHREFFGEMERDFSSSIMTNTTRQFDTYVSRGVMLNNYANIFGLIMQMRQVANHPDLILKKSAEGGQNILVCCICDEAAEEPIRSRCHHEFCRSCARDYVRSFEGNACGEPDCPRCHIPLSIDFEQPDIEQEEDTIKKTSIINRIRMEEWTSSTKIEMLVYDLYKLRSQKQTQKSIIFSQFTSMLQLIEWRLRRAGFNTVMLDGSMTPAQRAKSIDYFMNNVDVEIFLVSLKAGGVALNLTEASRVFIVDPWWNPAAEWQSADRCHRIGQKRPCVITRLCIEDSVESRMVLLQEKKANMINGTINHDKVAIDKLSPEDMLFLFRGN